MLQYFCQQTPNRIYYMSSKVTQQFELMKKAMKCQQLRKSESLKYRTVNTVKWKLLMTESLHKLSLSPQYDQHLIQGLKHIVSKVPQEKFVEAIINMQPYKPNFKMSYQLSDTKHNRRPIKCHQVQMSPNFDMQDETTTSGSVLKRVQSGEISTAKKLKRKQELIAMFIEEDVLSKEFSSFNHPYSKIIEGFTHILEEKFKTMIQKQMKQNKICSIEQIVETLSSDFRFIENFFKLTASPIVDFFNLSDKQQKEKFTEEINNFMVNYLRNNEKICLSIRKILRYHIKNSRELKEFSKNCPMAAQIEKFGLPKKFQIEGCYIYTTSEIISFCQLSRGKECLSKLAIIRDSIYKDIDEYYKEDEQNTAMQVSSQVQLEILKFSLVKLQIFGGQILSELKLLQVLYGQEEISYHFDQASYIHSQILIAFEALQNNL